MLPRVSHIDKVRAHKRVNEITVVCASCHQITSFVTGEDLYALGLVFLELYFSSVVEPLTDVDRLPVPDQASFQRCPHICTKLFLPTFTERCIHALHFTTKNQKQPKNLRLQAVRRCF